MIPFYNEMSDKNCAQTIEKILQTNFGIKYQLRTFFCVFFFKGIFSLYQS